MMNFNWLAWQRLPWICATVPQWRYALRNSMAMCLALIFAYTLQLDQPYWAMTSAAVVSFPTVGGAISKSLGRICGSLIGATVALIIAGHTLNDPWLFTFTIAAWLAFCTWISSHYQNNVAYAFCLSGYTAAIIAFTTVNVTEVNQVWDIAQARVCEVITGILCAGLMMMILPSTSDGDNLMLSLHKMHQDIYLHAVTLLSRNSTTQAHTAHEQVISQILTMNLLRVQAFWSHYRFRRQNNVLNYILHQQLRMTSVLSGLRRMLLNWPEAPETLYQGIREILTELSRPGADKYAIAMILRRMVAENPADFRNRAVCERLRYFSWLYLDINRWIRLIEIADADTRFQPPAVPSLARENDSTEAALSALRTFAAIIAGGTFWINSHWESGSEALTLTAIACVLYSSSPSPVGTIFGLLKTLLFLCCLSLVLKFGLMIQISALWQFLLFLFPLLITGQLLKLQQPANAAFWGQSIVFLGSFISVTNPPEWDYADFLNANIAKVCGVLLAWLAFQILQPSSDDRKSRRHIRALRLAFLDQLRRHPTLKEHDFESRVYHLVSQLKNSKNQQAKLWLLRWGVVLLNCSHIVWYLRSWTPQDPALMTIRDNSFQSLQQVMSLHGVRHNALETTLDQLNDTLQALQKQDNEEARELAGILWRLQCSLAQLQQGVAEPALPKSPAQGSEK